MKHGYIHRAVCILCGCVLCLQMILLAPIGNAAEMKYKIVDKENVVFRNDKNGTAAKIANMAAGTVVTSLGYEMDERGEYGWEKVSAMVELYGLGKRERVGYIRSDMVRDLTAEELNRYLTGGRATPAPANPTPTNYDSMYVCVRGTSVRLRQGPSTSTQALAMLPEAMLMKVVSKQGDWYQVQSGANMGYVQGNFLRTATTAEIQNGKGDPSNAGKPPNAPTLQPGQDYQNAWMYVVGTSVRLRQGPSTSTQSLEMLVDGAKIKVLRKVGDWYEAQTDANTGYIYASYLRKGADSGNIVLPTSTPNPNGLLVDAAAIKAGSVNVRSGSGMSFGKIDTLTRGAIVAILGYGQGSDGNVWYRVGYQNKTGYICGIYLRALKAGESLENNSDSPSGPSNGNTATYRTLKVGSKGEDVKRLQTKLKSMGYLEAGVITDYFGTLTRDALKAYQRRASLTVDGVAGPATQHKLYGTVPPSSTLPTSGPTNVPNIGVVELNDWYQGDIQDALKANRTLTVIDVATGRRLQVRFLHGANHADVEPLTAADTAVLKDGTGADRMYGSYRRPVWVICGSRTFAGSMYCVPHDEANTTIKDNNFPGVLCLHFHGSKTHTNPNGSGTQEHQQSIQNAYAAAPNRK